MSDLEVRPIPKFLGITTSSIKYTKNTITHLVATQICNYSSYKITLPLRVLGFCETNAILYSTPQQVNNAFKFLDSCSQQF